MSIHRRIQIFLMRTLGIGVALFLIILALLLIVVTFDPLPGESAGLLADVQGLLIVIHYLLVVGCLLVPMGLIKRATTALWFFRFFLIVGGLYVLTAPFSTPFPIMMIPGLIVIGNIWLSYQHWRQCLELPSNF